MGARIRTVLLDMDETLLVERASTDAALLVTMADLAATRDLDPEALGRAVLDAAGALWRAGPHIAYCRRIGIASWEGLWATFSVGDDPDTVGLRGFAPRYRREAWRQGLLRGAGLEDEDLVAELAERFVWERASRQVLYPECLPVLARLRAAGMGLVMLTNGDRDLQRRKAVASGLAPLFDHVVISGAEGVGKPDPAIFARALRYAGASAEQAVMVGDSRGRDIAGGTAAGLRTVWCNRFGESGGEGPEPWAALPDLSGLTELLRGA